MIKTFLRKVLNRLFKTNSITFKCKVCDSDSLTVKMHTDLTFKSKRPSVYFKTTCWDCGDVDHGKIVHVEKRSYEANNGKE